MLAYGGRNLPTNVPLNNTLYVDTLGKNKKCYAISYHKIDIGFHLNSPPRYLCRAVFLWHVKTVRVYIALHILCDLHHRGSMPT